jgi:hypothetical protein
VLVRPLVDEWLLVNSSGHLWERWVRCHAVTTRYGLILVPVEELSDVEHIHATIEAVVRAREDLGWELVRRAERDDSEVTRVHANGLKYRRRSGRAGRMHRAVSMMGASTEPTRRPLHQRCDPTLRGLWNQQVSADRGIDWCPQLDSLRPTR